MRLRARSAATALRTACLRLMDVVRTRHRLATGAAIAGLVAIAVTGGASAVAKRPKLPAVNVAARTPQAAVKAAPEKRCFDALRPVLAKPAWKITIERGMRDCFGSAAEERFDIDSEDNVLWQAREMPDRHLQLSLGERALIEGIVGVSCQSVIEHDDGDFLNVYPAGASRDDADWLIRWSPARETLEMLILQLETRYADDRHAELGKITLDLRVRDEDTRAWSRVRVADDILVVTRGERLLVRKALSKADVVALVDVLSVEGPPHDIRGSGTLVTGKKKRAVTFGEIHGPVPRYVADAMYCDAHRDASGCSSN
ncbi:MAG TPA: hypothetical protein VH142_20410 [Polyangiaceae bacterium]|nr:hypothetical protein [Polyangiaceae bacterium]